MDILLDIVLIVGPLVVGTSLSTLNMPVMLNVTVWSACVFITICGVYRVKKGWEERKQDTREKEYLSHLLERQELRAKGLPEPYIDGLGENPLLKEQFNAGRKYEKESKLKEAIEEFKKCLLHPKATETNRVAANILIGNCYYRLSKLKEAEARYQEALKIAKKVKDEGERLKGKSTALGNIGLIYAGLGKPEEALRHHNEALEIDRKIGYEQGVASDLGNIGNIYRGLGKPEEALRHYNEALEIFKRIGSQPQIEIVLKNIEIIEEEKRKKAQ